MKTKDLVRALQEADPAGETECCVGNEDIYFVEKLPAYYDGDRQILIRDPTKRPYWDIVGVRIDRIGEKIQIRTLSAREVLFDFPDMPVDDPEARHTSEIASWRAEGASSPSPASQRTP